MYPVTTNPTPGRPKPLEGEYIPRGSGASSASLALLDLVSVVMDRLFTIPGTRLRFGLNSLLLLVPILGDLLPTLVSIGILLVGLSNHRVPRIVAARMVLNSLLDASLGWIPVVGDVFDLYFKADTRNVRLLQQHARPESRPPTSNWRHWLFVVGILGLFGVVLVLIVLGGLTLVSWLLHQFRGGAAG